jgi:hypothetical protein
VRAFLLLGARSVRFGFAGASQPVGERDRSA